MQSFTQALLLRGEKTSTWGGFLNIVVAIILGIGLAAGLTSDEKIILLRYLNFTFAGILAFAVPWILFPQRQMYSFQALNPGVNQILRILLKRMGKIALPGIFLLGSASLSGEFIGLFSDGTLIQNLVILGENISLFAGIVIYITYRYARMGYVSQLWQEGQRGHKFMAFSQETGGIGVPAGSLPTLGTTLITGIFGMLAVVFGAYMQGITGLPLNALGGLILMFVGLRGWKHIYKRLDVDFFHTHGFYDELFHNPGGKSDGGRDPIPIQSLYWVPISIRTLVWISLRQMDRKIPVGRILVVGFLLYWSLIYGGILDQKLVIIVPVLLILIKNLSVFRIINVAFAPHQFQQRMGSPVKWFLARTFINLRWTLPVAILTFLTQWQVDVVTIEIWKYWLIADIFFAITCAAIATISHEKRTKYIYA